MESISSDCIALSAPSETKLQRNYRIFVSKANVILIRLVETKSHPIKTNRNEILNS